MLNLLIFSLNFNMYALRVLCSGWTRQRVLWSPKQKLDTTRSGNLQRKKRSCREICREKHEAQIQKQAYQTNAVVAVADCFAGQAKRQGLNSLANFQALAVLHHSATHKPTHNKN